MILAIDPGVKNLAYVIMDNKGKMLDYDLVISTYENLTTNSGIRAGNRVMTKLVSTLNSKIDKNTALVIERFVPRGMFRGNLAETTNILIGHLLHGLKTTYTYPLLASTWKNYRNRHYIEIVNKTIPVHIIDAYTMGLYFLEKKNRITEKAVVKSLKRVQGGDYGWKLSKGIWART